MKETNKRWYHIKARDMGIFQPKGKVITFWLFGESESDIMKILSTKNVKDVEWIKQKQPEFDN